ncbi:MAG: DNA-processing protein DprA, partial [Clostridia bacterium]|nr:DNA-processing protein DprA [Clostridia bacterium]
ELEESPAILFVKGELPPMKSCPTLGIVGTRECSPYGGKFAAGLAYDLVRTGFVIVSGMARGIDTYAHKGSLLAGGKTVAVLPCGVDVIAPKRNSELYSRICDTGAVVSEYLPGTQCMPYNFHLRNRIISGLSHGIAVIETDMKGGSMITVRHALEQGKIIFAVPGSPGIKTSEGTNHLLRSGASVCTCSEDVISEYEVLFGQKFERPDRMANISRETFSAKAIGKTSSKKSGKVLCKEKSEKNTSEKVGIPRPKLYCALSEKEELVINALKDGPLSADSVCDVTGMIFPQVVSILNGFELSGYVEALPGGTYQLKE